MKQCALCQEEIKGTLYYFKKEFYCQTCFNVIKEIRRGRRMKTARENLKKILR